MLDTNLYDTYYSLEDLYYNLKKINFNINYLESLDKNELFKIAVSNGIEDLAEFLYIHCEIEFELLELMNMTTPIFIPSIDQENTTNKIENIQNGNEGIRISIDGKDGRINKVIKRLIELKKYSTMRSKDKKFWYKFNKKYIPSFY
jgi:hypothetical protein